MRFRFGLFEFDAANRELRRDGVLVRLQAQPSQVLECLIQHAGEVVSREELQRAVWGDGTFVDFDRGLNFAMAQIRSALGDEVSEPRFIRTIPKRGYQFIAPIERIPNAETKPPQTTRERKNIPGVRVAEGLFVGLLLVAAAFAAGYRWRTHQASAHIPIVAVARFDNETGDASLASFSDALTDNVVERLTAAGDGRFQVIGNAQILRRSREERDLKAVESSLGAKYVILGQVLRSGSETRVLVHLIRLSDQTHLWVVRLDRALTDPLSLESEVAEKVAAEFPPRIAKDASGIALPPPPSQ
ncbi:MAG TPA: winged helix-turn-helix domain-containing protein [Candidatus Acidoferrum sp.]|nr:winged helix-turn-helix domain-containing protein [Candidatus Acidoferrum sp.]